MEEGVKATGSKITYNGVRLHAVFDGVYIRGYVINGVAKHFVSGGEAMAFIDRLKNFTVYDDGDLIEWEE